MTARPNPLDGGWLVVVDPQAVFADPATSPWGSPMWADTVPRIAALAAAYGPARTVVTRFVADPSLGGSWVPYYEDWPFALVPDDDPLRRGPRARRTSPATSSRPGRSASGRCCASSSATTPT